MALLIEPMKKRDRKQPLQLMAHRQLSPSKLTGFSGNSVAVADKTPRKRELGPIGWAIATVKPIAHNLPFEDF